MLQTSYYLLHLATGDGEVGKVSKQEIQVSVSCSGVSPTDNDSSSREYQAGISGYGIRCVGREEIGPNCANTSTSNQCMYLDMCLYAVATNVMCLPYVAF